MLRDERFLLLRFQSVFDELTEILPRRGPNIPRFRRVPKLFDSCSPPIIYTASRIAECRAENLYGPPFIALHNDF